jgi:hypothetical protein
MCEKSEFFYEKPKFYCVLRIRVQIWNQSPGQSGPDLIRAAVGASMEDEEADSESRGALLALVAMPPGPGGDAAPEQVVSRLESPFLSESPRDDAGLDVAALAESGMHPIPQCWRPTEAALLKRARQQD